MDDDERNPNPRNLGFLSDTRTKTHSVSSDLVQKPAPTILDRFRALLKEREDEIGGSADDVASVLPADEVVGVYEEVLSELTFNSKPIITDLTIIAGEQRECAEGIAEAICARIVEVPVEQKLPSLYLLDSIVKNIGREYLRHFAARLPQVFGEAYKQVHPNLHPAMRHLFGTWSTVFPSSVLRKIEAELQLSSPISHQPSTLRSSESPSPRPAHGIHVNPKYLEARRQFEHSGMDGQHGRGISTNLLPYGRKSSVEYGEYDFDQLDPLSLPQVGVGRVNQSRVAPGHQSTAIGAERHLTSPKTKRIRPSSPSRIGLKRSLSPPMGEFCRDISPARVGEKVFPDSRFGLKDREKTDWRERPWSGDEVQNIEAFSAYNLINGNKQQEPRALIDAYGNYRGKDTSHDKHPRIERFDVNGIHSNSATRKWQNVEEEEYDWEDMSPTFADRSRGNELAHRGPTVGNLSMKGGPARPFSDPEIRRRDWSSQAQQSLFDDPAVLVEDRIPVLGSGRGPMSRTSPSRGSRNDLISKLPGSYYPQESWNLPHHASQSSVSHLLTKSDGRGFQMPFSAANGIASSTGQKTQNMPPLIDNPPDAESAFQGVFNTRTRIGPSNSGYTNVNPTALMEKHLRKGHLSPPKFTMMPPLVPSSYLPVLPLPGLLQQSQMKNQFDMADIGKNYANQDSNKSFIWDGVDRKTLNSTRQVPLPHQQAGLISLNHPRQAQENFPLSNPVQMSSHILPQATNHQGHVHGREGFRNMILPNSYSGIPSSVPNHGVPGTSFQGQGSVIPSLPLGVPPSQTGSASQNTAATLSNPPTGTAFSGLIGSLMAQGLISLTAPASAQDSLGVEFNVELLKVRHESAIKALYVDLPRQCTTCGMRFKCQEEHSNHMDWHVTKNRISKNRKQNPSRKWFVSAKEWLSGAEALGTDAVPGFLPTEPVVDGRADEEMAVPADENQSACALCGDPFEDFYSDDTEEWMYKGAVYMNAPVGSTDGMDKSLLGPIVHAKCRSESTVVHPGEFVKDEGGSNEEGSQRKRMRS